MVVCFLRWMKYSIIYLRNTISSKSIYGVSSMNLWPHITFQYVAKLVREKTEAANIRDNRSSEPGEDDGSLPSSQGTRVIFRQSLRKSCRVLQNDSHVPERLMRNWIFTKFYLKPRNFYFSTKCGTLFCSNCIVAWLRGKHIVRSRLSMRKKFNKVKVSLIWEDNGMK